MNETSDNKENYYQSKYNFNIRICRNLKYSNATPSVLNLDNKFKALTFKTRKIDFEKHLKCIYHSRLLRLLLTSVAALQIDDFVELHHV